MDSIMYQDDAFKRRCMGWELKYLFCIEKCFSI